MKSCDRVVIDCCFSKRVVGALLRVLVNLEELQFELRRAGNFSKSSPPRCAGTTARNHASCNFEASPRRHDAFIQLDNLTKFLQIAVPFYNNLLEADLQLGKTVTAAN